MTERTAFRGFSGQKRYKNLSEITLLSQKATRNPFHNMEVEFTFGVALLIVAYRGFTGRWPWVS